MEKNPAASLSPASLRTRALCDLSCCLVLCGAFIGWRLAPSAPLIPATLALGALAAFAYFEIRFGPRSLRSVGLRRDNLAAAFRFSAFTLLPLVVGCLAYGLAYGIFRPAHFLLAALIYPAWGFFQQLLFQGVILEAFRTLGFRYWSIPLTSLLFVAIHFPSNFLMVTTAIGAPLFSLTYFFRPNVIPLALYHGVLGASLYYIFRQKDVLAALLP